MILRMVLAGVGGGREHGEQRLASILILMSGDHETSWDCDTADDSSDSDKRVVTPLMQIGVRAHRLICSNNWCSSG